MGGCTSPREKGAHGHHTAGSCRDPLDGLRAEPRPPHHHDGHHRSPSCADEDMGAHGATRSTTASRARQSTSSRPPRTLQSEYGIPIANKRVSVTPIAQIAAGCPGRGPLPARARHGPRGRDPGYRLHGRLLRARPKGHGRRTDRKLIATQCPRPSATTDARVLVASTSPQRARRHQHGRRAALRPRPSSSARASTTVDINCYGAAKFVVFANMVEDSPFMAGAVHGSGEADAVINVGVSGPGVMAAALAELARDGASLMQTVAENNQGRPRSRSPARASS